MPFGTLDAEFTEVKPKEPKIKKPKVKKPEVKKPEVKKTEIKEPVIEKIEFKEPEIDLYVTPPVPEVIKTAADTMEVTILSRNAAVALDLLTGLFFNTNDVVTTAGLSLDTDGRTLSELQKNRRKLSGLFMAGDISYTQPGSSEGIPTAIKMNLSIAGRQNRGIKVNFTVRDMNTGFAGCEGCDVLWAIADAPLYAGSDSYSAALASALNGAAESGKPVFAVMTEFEKYGKVSNIGGIYKVERRVMQALLPAVESLSADGTILPVQLYGGLVYRRTEGNSLVFGENEYGGMLAYKPEGCHIPLLFSLEAVSNAGKMLDDEIIKAVQQINRPQRMELFSKNR